MKKQLKIWVLASLLLAGCTKEKIVERKGAFNCNDNLISNRVIPRLSNTEEAQGCITLAADKNTPALGVGVGIVGYEDHLWFDIGADGRVNTIADEYSYSAPGPKDIGLITSRATLRLVSDNGKWKIYFHKGKLSANTKIVLFKLSVSNQDFLTYLDEKMEANQNYIKYLQLSGELDLIDEGPYGGQLEWSKLDEYNQLASEIDGIGAYSDLQLDKINGKPIIEGSIEIDYNQLMNSTLDKPVAVAW